MPNIEHSLENNLLWNDSILLKTLNYLRKHHFEQLKNQSTIRSHGFVRFTERFQNASSSIQTVSEIIETI